MEYVAVNEPPDPESWLPMNVPPTPFVPIGPIVTVNVSLAGKFLPAIVTEVSLTTEEIEKVGKLVLPPGVVVGAGVEGTGVEVGAGVAVVPGAEVGAGVPSGVASAVLFQNQL